MSPGIYLHIPFCRSRCSYCHFLSVPYERALAGRYVRALMRELEAADQVAEAGSVTSVYFGGGTPSLIPSEYIEAILARCRERFSFSADCEISLEANPGTLTADSAAAYRRAGVNRISLGAQSFADRELAAIGRLHTSTMILQSLDCLIGHGFANLNLDLMLGLPEQTAASWQRNLEILARLPVRHVSVYMLDLEEPSELGARVARGAVVLPDEDLVADLYMHTVEFLQSHGYAQYEISNFAGPASACRHNLKYWKREPVWGFGAGSCSFDGQFRYANGSDIEDYCRRMETGASPVAWKDSVGGARALQEQFFLGLRLTEGIDCRQRPNRDAWNFFRRRRRELDTMLADGLMEWHYGRLRLTTRGMLLSNEIMQLFV